MITNKRSLLSLKVTLFTTALILTLFCAVEAETIAYSSVYGTGAYDYYDFGYGIAVTPSGEAIVTGWGHHKNDDFYNSDVFVLRISADGKTILSQTFLGGRETEEVYGIALDATGAIYLCGKT